MSLVYIFFFSWAVGLPATILNTEIKEKGIRQALHTAVSLSIIVEHFMGKFPFKKWTKSHANYEISSIIRGKRANLKHKDTFCFL